MRARLSTYSLGFGHISVFSDDDIQSMPIIHRQHNSWNPREFHKYRLESLDKKIGGFKPLAIDNFITIAADRNLILMDTLTHSLRERDHRRMEWVEGMFKQEGRVFLVDGHHRALYMEEFVLRKFFDLRQVALQMERDLSAQKPCNGRLVGGIMKVIAQLERTIVHNSKWLAQVFDLGMYFINSFFP